MSKEIIHVQGQDIIVGDNSPELQREDRWVLVPIVLFAAITLVLMIVVVTRMVGDPMTELF